RHPWPALLGNRPRGSRDDDRVAWRRARTIGVAVMGTLHRPVGHLALDDPRVGPQSARVEPAQHLGSRLGDGGREVLRGKRPPGR
ncbi:hypothetical protein, partial [Ferrimicrobium acidiphilum]|uniref:hypothetical protein n=1 Tax=Ferrimicrobium acidiphilum TaxID=121039 RepID=UPI0023F4A3F2